MNKYGSPNTCRRRSAEDNILINDWADRYNVPIYIAEGYLYSEITKEEFLAYAHKFKEKLL